MVDPVKQCNNLCVSRQSTTSGRNSNKQQTLYRRDPWLTSVRSGVLYRMYPLYPSSSVFLTLDTISPTFARGG